MTYRVDAFSFAGAQVSGFRLRRHHLDNRMPRSWLSRVVGDMVGVQAQVSVMARIALWARLRDLSLGDVERALVNERTIVKTWSMRGALHLHRSSDLSVILGGLLSRRLPLEQRWIRRDQGWLAPVALFDGRVAGTWTYQRKSNTLHIAVQMFTPFGREIRRWKKKQATCRVSSKLLT